MPFFSSRSVRARRPVMTAVLTTAASLLLLTGCVTNEESGNPDGWEPILPETDPELAAEVPEDIAERGTLRMGTNPPFAPFEFKDSHGEIVGLEIDLARALASKLGLELTLDEQDFAMILPAVSAGTNDLGGSGFTDTADRRENYDFVDTLFAGVQWAQQTGEDVDPEDPCGLTIAVQRNTVSESDDVRPKAEACEEEGKEPIEILSYDTSDNAATALVLGKADAFSADSPITAWAVERSDGEIEPTGEIFQAAPYGFAVMKDEELGPLLAEAMGEIIESGEYEEILGQWNIDEGLLTEPLINEEPLED